MRMTLAAGRLAMAPTGLRPLRLARVWIWRAQSRRALARLDARLLDDVGISAVAARDEAAKPFWQD